MAQSTYVPWWEQLDIMTVVITPTRLQSYGQCLLNYAKVFGKKPFDGANPHTQYGTYMHALIHRYNQVRIAGCEPRVDEILAQVPPSVIGFDVGDEESRLIEFGRQSLIGYEQFLRDHRYGQVIAAEQYVRTPGRPMAGIPGTAVVLAGHFDVVAAPDGVDRPDQHASQDLSSVPGENHIACIDVKTRSVFDDLGEQPSSFVYDHLARFAYGVERVDIIQLVPHIGQWTRGRLTAAAIEAGRALCYSLVASVKQQPFLPCTRE